jgi:hypothetical protein
MVVADGGVCRRKRRDELSAQCCAGVMLFRRTKARVRTRFQFADDALKFCRQLRVIDPALERGVDVGCALVSEIFVSRVGEAGEDGFVIGAVSIAGDVEGAYLP